MITSTNGVFMMTYLHLIVNARNNKFSVPRETSDKSEDIFLVPPLAGNLFLGLNFFLDEEYPRLLVALCFLV